MECGSKAHLEEAAFEGPTRTENMSLNYSPDRTRFGLLPEPDRSPASFIASTAINGLILAAFLIIGAMARQVIVKHAYESTVLIFPTAPPPTAKLPQPPRIKPPEVRIKPAKIDLPKPDVKPLQMEAKFKLPVIKAARPAVVLARQPKAAMRAAMPAQSASIKPVTRPVHLGDTFGVTPDPNANRRATVAAIGNPYGGSQGPAVAPQGVVRSAGIGNGLRSGSNLGQVGTVALAGIPGGNGSANSGGYSGGGRVATAGIPTAVEAAPVQELVAEPSSTVLEIVSKPPIQYTSEARQLRIQGDVVLRVTFTATGQVVVQGVLRRLGYGLDEEARRVAEQIRFRPATLNGRPVDRMTNITITFQLT
jgi:TonB family protein